MIDFNDFKVYEEFAYKFYEYANTRINKYIFNCTFTVQYFSGDSYASTKYPNNIVIFVGNFIQDYKNRNAIMSMIGIAIVHELMHIEQNIDLYRYNTDVRYKDYIEDAVESNSFMFMVANANEIEKLFDFRIDIDPLYRITGYTQDYNKFSIEDYYLYTIINTVVRDKHFLGTIKDIFRNNKHITISFNKVFFIPIKYNGRFMEENIQIFSNFVFINCGAFDLYKIRMSVDIKYGESNAIIDFSITNRLMLPMR